jgi:hypothetical protein
MNYELAAQAGSTIFLHADDANFSDVKSIFLKQFIIHNDLKVLTHATPNRGTA